MWTPSSWQSKPLEQQADYPDKTQLELVTDELSRLPPLVSPQEVLKLRELTAKAASGEVFLLQGGDCAESFVDCNPAAISRKLQLMLQMSLLLMYGLRRPVIRVGRMAGQYAKPRSAHTETRDGISLPCYRGDLINDIEFVESLRQPDPARLLKGYSLASLTLNYIRTIGTEQLEYFCTPQSWEPEALLGGKVSEPYCSILEQVQQSFALLNSLATTPFKELEQFYTCHEALHLHYEQALTRQHKNAWYNLSTHMPWVGMRTAKPDSAHIEYLRGIENPVAIKVGPRMTAEWLAEICLRLNPKNELGKITLITRLGHDKVDELLPPLIESVKKQGLSVTWCSDPMHGNTQITPEGVKTRHFDHIASELNQVIQLHQEHESVLGGVHLELTGEAVTECIGGHCLINERDLHKDYRSLVDPRLNHNQAIELALNLIKSQQNQGIRTGFNTFESNVKSH